MFKSETIVICPNCAKSKVTASMHPTSGAHKYADNGIYQCSCGYTARIHDLTNSSKLLITHGDYVLGYAKLVTDNMFKSYRLPGGKIEKFETPAEALTRELKEELGLTVLMLQPDGGNVFIQYWPKIGWMQTFVIQTDINNMRIHLDVPLELGRAKWLPITSHLWTFLTQQQIYYSLGLPLVYDVIKPQKK